jgi:hypothetical protein
VTLDTALALFLVGQAMFWLAVGMAIGKIIWGRKR